MGTRNMTMVISDGKTRIAQYGQWDGYPSGQGTTILEFLTKTDLKAFKEKVNNISFYTEAEIEEVNKTDWQTEYPQLSRDVAGEILEMVFTRDITKLVDQSDFVNDSLFCEFGYVVDLDKNTLEVYTGYVKSPLDKTERFYKAEPNNGGYYPIKLLATFDLTNLPTEDEFLAKCNTEEE